MILKNYSNVPQVRHSQESVSIAEHESSDSLASLKFLKLVFLYYFFYNQEMYYEEY